VKEAGMVRAFLLILICVLGTASAAGWLETFDADPLAGGWSVAGDASLYAWDGERLSAAWDSTRPDSCFWRPLGLTLDGSQGFAASFDVSLADVSIGEGAFWEVSVGLLRAGNIGDPSFNRGFVGGFPTNLIEWDFFPTAGAAPPEGYVGHVAVDSAGAWYYADLPYAVISPGAVYTVKMAYDPVAGSLSLAMLEDGVPFASAGAIEIAGGALFNIDAFGVESYCAGGTAQLSAHGWVDNVGFALVPEPSSLLALGAGLAALAAVRRD